MSTRRAAFQVAGTAATVAATLLAALAGCTRSHDQGPAGPGAAPPAAILVRGGGPDPDSLDPQKARGFEAQSTRSAPPACSVCMRCAVSVVT